MRHLWKLTLVVLLLCQALGVFGQDYFIENKGQWPKEVLFKTTYMANSVYICKDKIVYSLVDHDA